MKSRAIISPFPWSRASGEYDVPARVHGIPVSVNLHACHAARAFGIWPFKRIVVGENWFYLSPREKRAFLLHEVGHCKRFHMEKRLLALPMLLINSQFNIRMAIEHEHEADQFAAREGYGIELLAAIKRLGYTSGTFYPTYAARAERVNQERAKWQSSM